MRPVGQRQHLKRLTCHRGYALMSLLMTVVMATTDSALIVSTLRMTAASDYRLLVGVACRSMIPNSMGIVADQQVSDRRSMEDLPPQWLR